VGMESALLEAAAKILEVDGPEALSVRRIASAAGVAPMGVYNHFSSKFGIVDALFIQGFERLLDAVSSIVPTGDPLADLQEAGRRYRALALAHPMIYRVMFLQAVSGYEPSEKAIVIAASAFESLAASVRRAMDAGVIAEASPTDTANLIWASIHGWMALELLGISFVQDQAAGFEQVCSSILRGLAP
jgi:AcrR family transcriptional regulator